jgi:hypothetical protein
MLALPTILAAITALSVLPFTTPQLTASATSAPCPTSTDFPTQTSHIHVSSCSAVGSLGPITSEQWTTTACNTVDVDGDEATNVIQRKNDFMSTVTYVLMAYSMISFVILLTLWTNGNIDLEGNVSLAALGYS